MLGESFMTVGLRQQKYANDYSNAQTDFPAALSATTQLSLGPKKPPTSIPMIIEPALY
jgi:hypothetical protein